MAINSATLVGRITKDIDLKTSQSGTSIARFTVAVDGYKDDDTNFIRIVTFGKTAENTAKFTHKGSLVGIQGEINTGSYDDKSGNRVYTFEVNARNVQFLDPKGAGSNNSQPTGNEPADPFASNGNVQIKDNDLPF